MQTISQTTKDQLAQSIDYIIEFGDGQLCVMRAVKLMGRDNLPRRADEMSYAAQDYMNETPKKDRDSHKLIDYMTTAPRRPEWPVR